MFIEAARLGISIHAIGHPGAQHLETMRANGVATSSLVFRKRFDLAAIRQLQDIIASERPDIIHVLRKPALFSVLQASRHSPARIVAYRGIVGNLSFFDPFSWLSFLHPRVDRIICVAEDIRRFFLEMRPAFLRLPAGKLVTIHKGHEVAWYRQARLPDLSALGIPADALVVGCVATMRRRKGIDLLVRAFDRVADRFNAYLLLVGPVEDMRITRAIAASPFRDRICTPGFRADATLLAGRMNLFVMPSTKREGLPRALIEAMAQGVPALVSDSGGSKDVVRDGLDGLVVPAGNEDALAAALSTLLGDESLRQRMGVSAMQRIERDFTVENSLRRTLAVYRELLAPPSAGQ